MSVARVEVSMDTYRAFVAIASDSFGYCDPPRSDFDDVREGPKVRGRETSVKLLDKVKPISGRVTIVNSSDDTSFIAGNGQELSIYDAMNVIPEGLAPALKDAMRRDVRHRKQNLAVQERKIV